MVMGAIGRVLLGVWLGFVVAAAQAPDCTDWNTKRFFQSATVEDAAACLKAGADLMARTKGGGTPLHMAARHSENPTVVEALLAAGADLHARDAFRAMPLHQVRSAQVAEVLLAAGADPNGKAVNDWTPLHFAINKLADADLIQLLIEAGADVDAQTTGTIHSLGGETPLHFAARYGDNPAVIKALLNAGADIEARAEEGWSPLHMAAAENENRAAVETLLAVGADVMARTEFGYTPLHATVWSADNSAMIETLLAAGADLNSRDARGHTPLHRALRTNKNPAVIKTLVAAGAEVNAPDKDGQRPLHFAARFNDNPAVVKALLDAGAVNPASSQDGWQFKEAPLGNIFGPAFWVQEKKATLLVSCFRFSQDIRPNPNGVHLPAVLLPRRLRVAVIWHGPPTPPSRPMIVGTPISFQVDSGSPWTEDWNTLFGYRQSVENDDAVVFLRRLLLRAQLTVFADFADGQSRSETFDLVGLDELLSRMEPRCAAVGSL